MNCLRGSGWVHILSHIISHTLSYPLSYPLTHTPSLTHCSTGFEERLVAMETNVQKEIGALKTIAEAIRATMGPH